MHLFFWKHSKKDEKVLIKKSCYDKLSKQHQQQFIEHNILEDESTHHVMDVNGDFQLYNTIGIGSISLGDRFANEGELPNQVPEDPFSIPKSDFEGFGGGSTQGAGAMGNYEGDANPTVQQQIDSYQIPDQSIQDTPSYQQNSPDMGINCSGDNGN